MSFLRVRRPSEDSPTETIEIEGQIRDLLRKDFAATRAQLPTAARLPPQPAAGDDQGVGQTNSLIQRLAGASVLEIEKLVAELQGLRDFLHNEADRVQHQIAGFAHLSEAATKSTKIIADSVSRWKRPVRETRLGDAQQHTTPAETEVTETVATQTEVTEGTCAS